MKLADTVDLMLSPNYKDRFKAEYYQAKIRLLSLRKLVKKYEANTLEFSPLCGIDHLYRQLSTMKQYVERLEVRAEIEGVDLEEEAEDQMIGIPTAEDITQTPRFNKGNKGRFKGRMLSFGEAMQAMEEGLSVRRIHWPENCYVRLSIKEKTIHYEERWFQANEDHFHKKWSLSKDDMFAQDWVIS